MNNYVKCMVRMKIHYAYYSIMINIIYIPTINSPTIIQECT